MTFREQLQISTSVFDCCAGYLDPIKTLYFNANLYSLHILANGRVASLHPMENPTKQKTTANMIVLAKWRFKRYIKSFSLFVATTFYNPFYIILQIKINFCYVPFNLFFSVFGSNTSLETLSVLNLTPS